MKKGISLVALIITIIVLIILTAAVVITGANTPQNAQLAVFYSNITSVQESVTLKMMNNMSKYATEEKNLEAYKWEGILKGYESISGEPNFSIKTEEINGKKIWQISEEMKNNLSIDIEELNKYYVDNKGVVYYYNNGEGFTGENGEIYYNRDITSATSVVIPTQPEVPTLGELIGNDAIYYGTRVDYTAGLAGNEVTDWKVFYKQTIAGEDYVYLITSEKLVNAQIPTITEMTKGTNGSFGNVTYWNTIPIVNELGIAQTYFMANWQSGNTSLLGNAKYSANTNVKCVSQLLNTSLWSVFANTETYGSENIIGAIGSPTAEMWVASWNQSGGNIELTESGTIGYNVNGSYSFSGLATTKDLYYPAGNNNYYYYWVASPSSHSVSEIMIIGGCGDVGPGNFSGNYHGVRPVVCLKADIPSYWEDEETKTLIKIGVQEN